MKEYLVSVIIPIYNGEKTLIRALNSVIKQSIFEDTEIVLIDDCSNDKSFFLASSFSKKFPKNIHLFRNKKNLGIAQTQNLGLKEANGEFIARLDQDDEWVDKRKLEKQCGFLVKNKDYGIVGTWAKVINETGPNFILTPSASDEDIRNKFLMASMFVSPSVVFRRKLVDDIGFYREDLQFGTEDYEYWLRIGTVAKLKNLEEFCIKYHYHPESYSNLKKIQAIREHVRIIKDYKKYYPHYFRSFMKNWIQFNLLKIKPMRMLYNFMVPRIGRKGVKK